MDDLEFLYSMEERLSASAGERKQMLTSLSATIEDERTRLGAMTDRPSPQVNNAVALQLLAWRTLQGQLSVMEMQDRQIEVMYWAARATAMSSISSGKAAKAQRLLTAALVLVAVTQVIVAVIIST